MANLTEPDPDPEQDQDARADLLPVVGIGASAGGLNALRTFFQHVEEDTDLAFVVVVHLSPDHESHLADLLQPHVKMPVQQVTETVPLKPNHVYVIPPGCNLNTIDTHLRLSDLEERRRERAPIDHFFRTLAKTHDGHSVGVVLTGTGSDGALGLREIHQAGGLTIVQDPNEAEYDGMPQSAIATGVIDQVLPLGEIPGAILSFARTQPRVNTPDPNEDEREREKHLLSNICAEIRAGTGRDFARYKTATVLRRISRRMQLARIEDLEEYLLFLRSEPDEVRALADDVLITVTSFFRDPDAFAHLEAEIIPEMFDRVKGDDAVRAWIVGCATGEEAYTVAMLLLEEAGRRQEPPQVQVFASDLHERALKSARDGFYPGDIETDVSSERLARWFTKEDGGYRIKRELREMVIFAPHNILGDPPFSRIDLVSCRNLMIYLNREVQSDVIGLFHYALRPSGFLMLGTSETVDGPELFHTIHKTHSLYRKRDVATPEPRLRGMPALRRQFEGASPRGERLFEPANYDTLHRELIAAHAPPSILVGPDDRVVHVSEHAGRYLAIPGGAVTAGVHRLVREELRIDIRSALHEARQSGRPVRTRALNVRFDGEVRSVVADVRPARDPQQEGFLLVIFDERESPPDRAHDGDADDREVDQAAVGDLEAELERTRHRLQTIIEEYETTQQEMWASNEELQSTNEELRSTMEELETSKEELQSMNEELQTVNQENRHKVDELAQLSGDLQNLFSATEIATLFLDRSLRILRFTPRVGELFSVRPADRGRPLGDLTHRLGYEDLLADAHRVIERLVPIEREIQDVDGRWFLSRILPYRSVDDRIEGVVITFIEISERKRSEEEVRKAKVYAESIIETLHEPLLVLEPDLRVKTVNEAFYDQFGVEQEATIGRKIYDLGNGQWDIPELRTLLEDVLPDSNVFIDYEVRHTFEGIGERVMLLNARRLDHVQFILLGIRDITEEKRSQDELRAAKQDLEIALAAAGMGTWHLEFPGGRATTSLRHDRVFGYTEPVSEWSLDIFREHILSEDREKADQAFQRAAETGKLDLEIRVRRLDGAVRWLYAAGRAYYDRSGQLVRMSGVNMDITERMLTAAALRESEERFRLVVENAHEFAIFMLDVEGRIVSWNPGAQRILGYTEEEAVGETVAIIFTAEDREAGAPAAEMEKAARDGQAPDLRWHLRKDGSRFWAEGVVVALRDGADNLRGFAKLMRDETERKLAEEALRDSEERYRTLFDSMDEGFCVIEMVPDEQGRAVDFRFVETNPAFERHTGLLDAVGSTIRAFGPVHEKHWLEMFSRVARTGESQRFDHQARSLGGRWFDVFAFRVDSESSPRVAVLFKDVTEQKRAHRELVELAHSLEQRVEERTRTVQELATTLTMAEQEERRRIARVLHDDLQQLLFGVHLRLDHLVSDVSALEATTLEAEFGQVREWVGDAIDTTRQLTVDLSPPVLKDEGLAEALGWLVSQMRQKHSFVVHLDVQHQVKVSDEDLRSLFFQATRELLFNAVKHSGRREATVVLSEQSGSILIEVSDRGVGFTVDEAQGRASSKGGFGLFSVRERLRLVGGSVDIESTPGKGTRVRIHAPTDERGS